nr:MAG TPA: DNA directed DNA polymerase [Caudoviricetes sp.]
MSKHTPMEEEEGSVFLRHEPCPECRKHGGDIDGNNLARYSDGHAHCFCCGYYERGEQRDESEGTSTNNSSRGKRNFSLLDVTYRPITARGLTQETCQLFGYGISRYHGVLCHVAPYYDQHGDLIAQHIRMDGKQFRWIGESKDVKLFGQNLWKRGGKRVIITEGEIDCLSVSQLQGNKWPVVSLPNGAQSAVKAFRCNLDWLSSFSEVVLAFDMDEPGQEAAKECAALLPPGKAFIASLPAKDANECLMQGQGQALVNALWQADEYRPDGIKAGKDLWDELMTPPAEGYDIPYPELNDKLHGLRKGELYLFTAGSGVGKSTIVNEIAYHLKMQHGLSLGIMALEESPARNARRYIGIHLNKPLHLPEAFRSVSQEDMRKAFDEVMGKGWWIYDHFGSSDIDTLLGKLRYMAVALGCDVVVLDHISIIVSGLDDMNGADERKTIDILMSKLRALIEETGIMVLAVVHLKRPDKGKSWNEGRQVSLTDLRGSGSLEQLSDAVVALERDQQAEGEEANRACIRVLKNRPVGMVGEAGCCVYHPDTGRLLPASPFDTPYGAEDGKENRSADGQNAEAETDF